MTEYESGKQVAFEHTILEVLEICKNSKSPEEIILVNKNLTLSKNKSEVNIRNKLFEKLIINSNMKKSARNNMNILDRRKTDNMSFVNR